MKVYRHYQVVFMMWCGNIATTLPFIQYVKAKAKCVTVRIRNDVDVRMRNVRKHLRINNQQDASRIQNFILSRNSTCFGHLLCPSSGVISCTRGNWYVSCRLCGRCLGESGWNQLYDDVEDDNDDDDDNNNNNNNKLSP